ncbi:MAG: cytidine deaminase [Acidobacteria bacterium]|nr:cytidine deaminase [Acidobacteriota bacterium]
MSAEPVFHLPTPDHGAKWEGVDWETLVNAAVRCRERAYAPYSDFRVGAALLAANGNVYVGCNVENRLLGLTLCAERGALSAAVADGQASFAALAIATGSAPPCAPCGQCRDALAEFSRDLPIVSVTAGAHDAANWRRFTLHELLPEPFVLDRSRG